MESNNSPQYISMAAGRSRHCYARLRGRLDCVDNLSRNSGTSVRAIVQSECTLRDTESLKKMQRESPSKSVLWLLRFHLAYGALQISFKVFHRQLNQVCWEDSPWSSKPCNPYSTMQLFLNFKTKHFRGNIFKLLQKYTSTQANTFNLVFKLWLLIIPKEIHKVIKSPDFECF